MLAGVGRALGPSHRAIAPAVPLGKTLEAPISVLGWHITVERDAMSGLVCIQTPCASIRFLTGTCRPRGVVWVKKRLELRSGA